MSFNCYKCNTTIVADNIDSYKVGFRDECNRCKNDLHCCKNCKFFDPSAYNECRESQAERVVDKEKRNLCEYFGARDSAVASGSIGGGVDKKSDALKKLDDLFK